MKFIIKHDDGSEWTSRVVPAAAAPHILHAIDPNRRVFVKTLEDQEAAQHATELMEDIESACNYMIDEAEHA